MKQYTYEVRRVRGWSVIARGPKGGTRWIATYTSQIVAEYIAKKLNDNEGR